MQELLIYNIKTLFLTDNFEKPLAGAQMATPPMLQQAWLFIKGEIIADFGTGPVPQAYFNANQTIDANGKMVLPAWADSHTHIIYDGSREDEFVYKIKGMSYEAIAANGGGILNSAKRLQKATEDQLFEQAEERLHEVISLGTGAMEIKSGYGLTVADEIKMLRVAKRLQEIAPIPIKTTLLAAHALPEKFKENRQQFINLVIHEMIPAAHAEGLANYIDVFCDKGFFSVSETDQILTAASKFGMKPKIHANELDFSGGIQLGVQHQALSVDHLEYTGDAEIEALLGSSTMPTLLPSTAFFLNLINPPARKMIDAGLPIALASDYNPGSSPSGNMQLVVSLACIKLKMLPEEALVAATINGAFAMELDKQVGSIAKGKKANLIITKPINSLSFIPYAFGTKLVETVVVNGLIY